MGARSPLDHFGGVLIAHAGSSRLSLRKMTFGHCWRMGRALKTAFGRLREPVKEEEDARARDADFDRIFAELLGALGLDSEGALPAWWQGWPAQAHVRRWIDDLGLSAEAILAVATETRQ